MVKMGIDQSLTGTGITVFNGEEYLFYLIKTEKTKNTKAPSIDYTRRLIEIKKQIKKIIKEKKVAMVAIEGMAYGSRGRSILDIGGLSHLIREALLEEKIKFIVVPPKTLKKYWTGNGNANKIMMIEEAENRCAPIPYFKKYKEFPDKKFDDNIVDSFALCNFINDFNAPEFVNKIEHSNDIEKE